MFISRHGPNRQYAYITTSYREDGRVKTKDEYLGRIVDYDKGIFKSKDRGVFTFDMSTGEYGVPESSYVPNEIEDRRKREHSGIADRRTKSQRGNVQPSSGKGYSGFDGGIL